MTTKTDEIVDENNFRYELISRKYDTLKSKLENYSKKSEEKDKILLDSFKQVLAQQERTASELARRNIPVPQEPSPLDPKEDYYSNQERRRAKRQLLENQNNQYRNDISRCFIHRKGL